MEFFCILLAKFCDVVKSRKTNIGKVFLMQMKVCYSDQSWLFHLQESFYPPFQASILPTISGIWRETILLFLSLYVLQGTPTKAFIPHRLRKVHRRSSNTESQQFELCQTFKMERNYLDYSKTILIFTKWLRPGRVRLKGARGREVERMAKDLNISKLYKTTNFTKGVSEAKHSGRLVFADVTETS